jgi:hypothetical protein
MGGTESRILMFGKADVERICKQYPQAFGGDTKTLDARRRLLIPIICRAARAEDGPIWFLINRLDRNDDDPKPGRLTADVIWNTRDNNHVDVLTSTGAFWEAHGPVTDRQWIAEHPDNWPSWEDLADPPPPPPPPPPGSGEVTQAEFDAFAARVRQHLKP